MRDLGTILGVWAHPDDETYLSGGIMADAVRRGQRVVCATATRGEAGSQDEERWPPSEIAKIREGELMDCLAVLGVTEHHWLDFVDGRCASVPHQEGVAKVQAIMEDIRPDSVLTFGPDGQTGHPDHLAVHAWTTDAFERSACAGAHLYYASVTPEWAERFVDVLNEAFNVFEPGTPKITPRDELGIDHYVDGELFDKKMEAIWKQRSQVEGFFALLDESLLSDGLKAETFSLGRVA